MIRVIVADDQAMFRAGLRSLLDSDASVEVVAEAADGGQAIEAARRHAPDVVLMDIRMPHIDGIAATHAIRAHGSATRVLVLTTFDLDEYVFAALRAGASGFLLKDATAEELLHAVHTVGAGDALLAPSAVRRVIEAFAGTTEADPALRALASDLTPREVEVLRLVARGRSNAEIADALVLSLATVKSHIHALLGKLGARDRVQAVVFAYESGLVKPGSADPGTWLG
jgi:DNA-binding NarL/FixJ family response regulator